MTTYRKETTMSQRILRGTAAAALLGCLALTGCGGPEATAGVPDAPAQVKHPAGLAVGRITLSDEAMRRLGVRTEPVREQDVNGVPTRVIPYSAVLYDPTGATYAYSNPQPLVYVRVPLTVSRIDGEQALLADGPPVGTAVVTVGAAELFGTEFDVGGE